MTNTVSVMIATPLRHFRDHHDLPPQIGRALRDLAQRPDAAGYAFEFAAACGGLCSARNRLVHEFLKSSCVWLLWHDSDLWDQHDRQADAILRLLSWRQPVIGGMYCKRDRRPRWVATWLPAAEMQERGILQAVELGGGFKLYHRRVFEELRRIFGEDPLKKGEPSIMYRERETGEMIAGFYQIPVIEGDLLSEDYFVDHLCRSAGIPILADTVVRLRQRDIHGEAETWYPSRDESWPPIPAEDAS